MQLGLKQNDLQAPQSIWLECKIQVSLFKSEDGMHSNYNNFPEARSVAWLKHQCFIRVGMFQTVKCELSKLIVI